jgi:hypothetical protein
MVSERFKLEWTFAGNKPMGKSTTSNAEYRAKTGFLTQTRTDKIARTSPARIKGENGELYTR